MRQGDKHHIDEGLFVETAMSKLVLSATLALSCLGGFAAAQNIGTASGHFKSGDVDIPFRYALAVALDDVDQNQGGATVRIILSDKEIAPEAAMGVVSPPVVDMGVNGEIQGLELDLNPNDRSVVTGSKFYKDTNIRIAVAPDAWKRLAMGSGRVSGEARSSNGEQELAVVFDAPVYSDLVQQTLVGVDAEKSPFADVVRAHDNAFEKGGDFERYRSRRLNASAFVMGKVIDPAYEYDVRELQIVVRKHTAVIHWSAAPYTMMVFEDGAWKIDR